MRLNRHLCPGLHALEEKGSEFVEIFVRPADEGFEKAAFAVVNEIVRIRAVVVGNTHLLDDGLPDAVVRAGMPGGRGTWPAAWIASSSVRGAPDGPSPCGSKKG